MGAVALPALQAGGDEGLFAENNKKFDVLGGNIELKVTDVNAELGEIGGVFVHKQPSDTDLGSKQPKEVLLKGNWFATVGDKISALTPLHPPHPSRRPGLAYSAASGGFPLVVLCCWGRAL